MRKIISKLVLFHLRLFAKIAVKISKVTVIGIGGSVGKSSTRDALYAILKEYFSVSYTEGNSETGVPLGILGLHFEGSSLINWLKIIFQAPFHIGNLKKFDYFIVEMGTDDPFPPKNMDYLLSIIKPHISLFLNSSAAHTMQFSKALTEEEKKLQGAERTDAILKKMAFEDGKIITRSGCKVGIYSSDNKYVQEEIATFKKALPSNRLLSFGKANHNDIFYLNYKVDTEKTIFDFETSKGKLSLNIKNYILPSEYREVFAAAIITALELGLSIKKIQTALEKNFTLPKSRSSVFKGIKNSIIIDSSYNASPTAVEAFLDLLSKLKKQTGRPIMFIFGDMEELDEGEKYQHEAVGQKMLGIVDHFLCTGSLCKKYVMPYLEKHQKELNTIAWFKNSKELGAYAVKKLADSSIILVKGSQNGIFLEEAIKALLVNKKDQQNLCRQERFWQKQKDRIWNLESGI